MKETANMEEQSKPACITGIYLITHIATERPYVGLCGRIGGFEERWEEHRNALRNNEYSICNPHFQNAWNKYGEKAFSFTVHTYIPQRDRNIEDFYKFLGLEELKVMRAYPNNLNGTVAGEFGMTHRPKVAKKISDANIEKMKDPVYKAKKIADINSPSGTRKKIAINKSPEIRKLRSLQVSQEMKKPELKARRMSGIHSIESQLKATIGKLAKWQDPEYREKMKIIRKEQNNRPEVKKKKSMAAIKYWSNPTNIKHGSNKSKAAWERRKQNPEQFSIYCEKLSNIVKQKDKENPNRIIARTAYFKTDKHKQQAREQCNSVWKDPIKRAALLEKRKIAMADPEYRRKQGEATRERHRKNREAKAMRLCESSQPSS